MDEKHHRQRFKPRKPIKTPSTLVNCTTLCLQHKQHHHTQQFTTQQQCQTLPTASDWGVLISLKSTQSLSKFVIFSRQNLISLLQSKKTTINHKFWLYSHHHCTQSQLQGQVTHQQHINVKQFIFYYCRNHKLITLVDCLLIWILAHKFVT